MKTFKIKSAFLACAIVASVATLTSCSKDNKIAPAPEQPVITAKSIHGSWTGKYGSGNSDPNLFFSANIKEAGLLEIKDKDGIITGTGTWTLDEVTFHATYKYTQSNDITYTLDAKYDEQAKTLTGSWSATFSTGGDFYWNKD